MCSVSRWQLPFCGEGKLFKVGLQRVQHIEQRRCTFRQNMWCCERGCKIEPPCLVCDIGPALGWLLLFHRPVPLQQAPLAPPEGPSCPRRHCGLYPALHVRCPSPSFSFLVLAESSCPLSARCHVLFPTLPRPPLASLLETKQREREDPETCVPHLDSYNCTATYSSPRARSRPNPALAES